MPEPLYRQIAEDLRLTIESGELAPGTCLPTELELRQLYNAPQNTLRDAAAWLISRGLVETRPGQGMFVVEKFVPFISTLSEDWQTEPGLSGGEATAALEEVGTRFRTPTASKLRVEVKKAEGYVAELLQVSVGTSVISRHQERHIDNQPWSLQTSYYPMSFVARGAVRLLEATDIEAGVVKYLQETLGLKQTGYRDWITVRAPEMTPFNLSDHGRIALFRPQQAAFDQTSSPSRPTATATANPTGISSSHASVKCRPRTRARCDLARSGPRGWNHDKPSSTALLRPPTSRYEEQQKHRRPHQLSPTRDRAPSVGHNGVRSSRTRD